MKTIIINKITYIVGQNATDNWDMLNIPSIKEYDIFFHLSSFPSCYVILITNDVIVSQKDIITGASLCKSNSKYRHQSLYVDMTPFSNIKKGGVVGEVIYKSRKKVKKIKI